MELIDVEILTTTVTGQYGTLAQGDILRTSPAFARHLVKEAYAANYINAKDDTPEAPAAEAPPAQKAKPSSNKAHKAAPENK